MLPMEWAWLPDASAGVELAAALLSFIGAALAVAQDVRARRKKATSPRSGDDPAEEDPDDSKPTG